MAEPRQTESHANRRRHGQESVAGIDAELVNVLARFPSVVLAMLFDSNALGHQRGADSDLDVAVAAHQTLTAAEKMALIEALAERTGRPVDLVDLRVATEPLLRVSAYLMHRRANVVPVRIMDWSSNHPPAKPGAFVHELLEGAVGLLRSPALRAERSPLPVASPREANGPTLRSPAARAPLRLRKHHVLSSSRPGGDQLAFGNSQTPGIVKLLLPRQSRGASLGS